MTVRLGADARRLEVGLVGRPAPALAAGDLVLARRPPATDAVEVVGRLEAGADRAVDERVAELVGVDPVLDVQRPVLAVQRRAEPGVALGLHEVRQHVVEAPAGGAVLVAPGVVVGAVAADVDHRVHRRAAAERLHPRPVGAAAVQLLLLGGRVVPVPPGLEQARERRRDADLVGLGLAARPRAGSTRDLRVLGQPRGEHRAGAAGADDDVVVGVARHGPNLLRVGPSSRELERVPIVQSVTVSGTCAPSFEPLRDLLAANLADGTDAGASVAVVHDGELVADLWGGEARPGEPWAEDTVVHGLVGRPRPMAALTALVLADRGELDLDAPVSSYWPEFRRDDVLVRHLLSHTSGYAGWTEPLRRRRPARPRGVRADARRAGAVVGAGHGVRLPHDRLRPPARRAGPRRHRRRRWPTSSARSSPSRSAPTSTSACRTTALDRCADLIAADRVRHRLLARCPRATSSCPTVVNPLLDVRDGGCNTAGVPAGVGRRRSAATATPASIARAQSVVSHGGEVTASGCCRAATVDRIFEVQADGPGPGAVRPAALGHRLPAARRRPAPAIPDGRVVLVDRLGRLDRRQRPRPPDHRRLRDEPDGRHHFISSDAHRRLRAHGVRVPGGAVTVTKVCIIGAGCSGHHHREAAQGPRHRLRPVRAVRRRGRQLVLPQPQRPLGGLRVAAHRHLEDPAPVRGLPGARRVAGLPEPPADARLLPCLRRPLRAARRDQFGIGVDRAVRNGRRRLGRHPVDRRDPLLHRPGRRQRAPLEAAAARLPRVASTAC